LRLRVDVRQWRPVPNVDTQLILCVKLPCREKTGFGSYSFGHYVGGEGMGDGIRVIEGDAVEVDGALYRLAGISLQSAPRDARVRLQMIIAGARSVHFIDW
jgi:hypothetical protein